MPALRITTTVDWSNSLPKADVVTEPIEELPLDSRQCPLPRLDYPNILMGHGGGGKLTQELLEHVFLPAFENPILDGSGDSAVFSMPPGRIAFSTDSYVVQPLFFPGGSIGDLAVNGTVNDIAMSGGIPIALSVAFILEEGFEIVELQRIVADMARAASRAGVTIVTGDTKVVERGHGDGCYINTSGLGSIPDGIHLMIPNVRPGDSILISGTLGDHGMAILSVREGLAFESPIRSDTAPLHALVQTMLAAVPSIRLLRDPTRGGLAMSLNEIANVAHLGVRIRERSIPIDPAVQSACDLLGLDPLLVANEGKLIAVVPADAEQATLDVMRRHPLGRDAACIGSITAEHPGMVVAQTPLGASRVIAIPIGEQLPRIC